MPQCENANVFVTRLLGWLLLLVCPVCVADEVSVYSARQEALIKPLLDRYTQATGVKVNLVSGEADPLLKRLELEGANSPADLLITVDVARLSRAKEAGLLQPVRAAELEQNVPPAFRDRDGYWYGLSLRSRVIVYSKERVQPTDLSTYEALADSKWAHRLCIRSSNNTYNQSLVSALIAHQGVEKTEQWARGLVANFARPPQGGDKDQVFAIASGQCDAALVNTYYVGQMINSDRAADRDAAAKVAIFWPNQSTTGAHMNLSGAAVTRSARHVENARALIAFLLTPESQRWYADVNNEYPVRSDIPLSATLESFGTFRPDPLNLSDLGVHTADAIAVMDRAGWK